MGNKKSKKPQLDHEENHHYIHDEPPGHSFINVKTEVLDYEYPECDLIRNTKVQRGLKFEKKLSILRFLCFVCVGAFTGLLAFIILFIHEELAEVKYHLLKHVLDEYTILSFMAVGVWHLCVLIPAMIGCLLVVFIEPKAAGGGVSGVIGFVNGVDTSATFTLKILIIKCISVLCCITAGLAGGMEGPMVHIACIIGMQVLNVKIGKWIPFKLLRTDAVRRDLLGGGIASGIAAAFFAPIGGFVMSIEEGMLYWNLSLIFNILICSILTHIILVSMTSVTLKHPGELGSSSYLFFSIIKEVNFSHNVEFMTIYCLEAVFFGIMAAFWNMCQTRLILWRKKFVVKKWQQILEMFTISFITATLGWSMMAIFRKNCVDVPNVPGLHFGEVQMECEDKKIAGIGTLLTHTQGNAIRFLFIDSDSFDIPTLAVYGIVYFFLSVVTMGSYISAGIFIPNLLAGAVWGRLIGELLKKFVFKNDKSFRPALLAIIGSVAQLCGVIRIPFTLATMMVESSANTKFLFPIFITQMITTVVGNLFNHSIYHTQCFLAGQPIAETESPPFCADIEVQRLIQEPIFSLRKVITVKNILDVLKATKYNMFPILNGKKLQGTILRYQLLKIIHFKMYLYGGDDLSQFYDIYSIKDYIPPNLEAINQDDHDMGQKVDLESFMNKSPYTLLANCSIHNAYDMIAHVGTRHIIVVNASNDALGVLTRKDVLFLREHYSVSSVHVKRLPRK